jgi:hypothetical protein
VSLHRCAYLLRYLHTQVSSRRRPNESDAEWARRQEAARQEVNSHLLVFIHGSLQALTAIGLLQVGGQLALAAAAAAAA